MAQINSELLFFVFQVFLSHFFFDDFVDGSFELKESFI